MNKTRMSQMTGLGLILITLLLLAGCQPQEVVPVEAAPAESILPEEAAALVRVDPADRKFYSGTHAAGTGTSGEVGAPASIAPADRKFYSGAYATSAGIARELVVPADTDPADRKFYNGWITLASGITGDVVVPADTDPADRKFFNRK